MKSHGNRWVKREHLSVSGCAAGCSLWASGASKVGILWLCQKAPSPTFFFMGSQKG